MPPSPTVASWHLGIRLREKREALGLTGADVVKPIDISVQYLSAVEHGRKKLSESKLAELIAAYEFDADEAAELRMLRERTNLRGWWSKYTALFNEQLLRLFGFEHGAEAVRAYDNGLMNGLLQTEEYAHAIISAGSPNIRLAEVDRRVEARMKRQHLLTADHPLALTAIMSESTIHQQVGGPAVLARQLRHVLDLLARLPETLDIAIVPYSATGHHAMGGSSFNLMSFDGGMLPTLVWQETVTTTELIEDALTVREYSLAYTELAKLALDRRRSIELIQEAIKELE